MELNLVGRRALVTGSSGGIGAAIVRGLAREGVRVIVHGRNAAAAHHVADTIEKAGGTVIVALGDIRQEEGAAKVVQVALDAFGGIDILVNNVGRADEDSWDHPDPIAWAEAYDTNVLSAVRMIRLLLPQMKERGWGRLLQITSIAALHPAPDYGAYGAAKAALLHLTTTLARGLDRTGITANAISPGVILSPEIEQWVKETAWNESWEGGWSDHEARFTERFMPNLVGRMGRPEEIADLVTFLASPRADYLTAAHFAADGGGHGIH